MRILRHAALIAALPFLVAAAPPTALEPSSPWGVDYGAQRCTLWRAFGTGKDIVKLAFEQSAPRQLMSVLIMGPGVPRTNGRNNMLSFEPLGIMLRGGQSVFATDNKQNGLYFTRSFVRGRWGLLSDDAAIALARTSPPEAGGLWWIPGYKPPPVPWESMDWHRQPEQVLAEDDRAFSIRAAMVETAVINPDGRKAVALHVGSLKAPLDALEKCARDSLKDWGIDSRVEATVATMAHPTQSQTAIISSKDYPARAISQNMESNLELWLNIDATGRISSCRTISSFASPDINDMMCKLVQKRQSFVPVKNIAGVAVPSYYIETFRFVLAD